jgi:diaminohydroxyphosphoribosylaminopyrimidine deaminase/5-amino-6-(5-phosphoribosylamino)uracil reductase
MEVHSPSLVWSALDEGFMGRAFELARSGLGKTAPNPSVGCVLLRDGMVVGEGRTQGTGRPHGEAVALKVAGERAAGSTAYVTLEPCAHESSRGPACSDGLIEAGVRVVFISVLDPDPRTAGMGVARLREAGLEVHIGLLEEAGQTQIAGFAKRLRTGLPWLHIGQDDGTFDCVLNDGATKDLQQFLAHLGQLGAMRVCVVPGSFCAKHAIELALFDSIDVPSATTGG